MKIHVNIYYFVIIGLAGIFFTSCNAPKKTVLKSLENNKHFSGFVLYEPEKEQTLVSYNADKYFTPASTLKLFTLYVSLKSLSDSIASISYYETDRSLYFKALGDPSFLYDSLPNNTYDFLSNTSKELILVPQPFEDFIYGDGWQWDDFQYYYMPEKSQFPLYGNLAFLNENVISPVYFSENLSHKKGNNFRRDFYENIFYTDSSSTLVPFKTSIELSRQLLSDTLKKPVYISESIEEVVFTPYISTPTLPLYHRLMDESENFIAEQLFLMIAKEKTDTFSVKNSIQFALDSLLTDMPGKAKWVDASGLSRYNLISPDQMLYLLKKMNIDFERTFLKNILPKNGEKGSLQKWYPSSDTYLYAKTGSLSNQHNLSGFIETKKGKWLIFSYMNNNYMQDSKYVRQEMNEILQYIYHTY